jgi:hypothetical protein
MSSHHFVKEGQEPALFIMEPVSFEIAGPLLEWAPMVVASEDALECVIAWGIKIDVVIAAERNIENLKRDLHDQAPIKILWHLTGESLLTNGLHFLISTKQSHVNILVSPSDTVFMQLAEFIPFLQMTVIDDEMRWSAISSGKYEKWVEADAKFRVRRNFQSQDIYFDGIVTENDHLKSKDAGLIQIQSEKSFWVAQSHL